MRREVTSADELRAIVGEPTAAVAKKVTDRLSPAQQSWLKQSPLGFVATTDAHGRVDVSPKGDPPGFVQIIDDTTIAIPERPGNRRVDGFLNVLQRPHVGTVFVIPGRGDTLRINGTARILSDADYFEAMVVGGKRPILALEIAIEEVFFHCPKAFLRSDAWKPDSWNPTAVPSVAQMAKAFKPDQSQAELDAYYSEDNLRKLLY
ncbi:MULTISPECIES: pyridoxamine 5'-phosphate oxidase family protein [Mycolicibacterium]|jgi:PPOX class probable FMN-dependent enzyme|uniref:pyridoxamine 5'-phosphate oxidase family protein n=1 Tax=Mycolicibacterium TaxID=1866885 RepID=UPI0007EBDBB0|nr:pyridoxamine 5'-phosphate oxidase family protein [Mycolicibacterium fortuitum]NOQ00170.1 pyridoxamine 5'-phosphate oxidase family protein [Mycolicibacterium fortuitum]NOQ61193.1 pyridoxamine 5'-phosphate oxidase family protein [Mycolicibacterium fortuitum]OBA99384.1 pyridoxamine 5'-phosphate oxidase [Mycolicibacterium fortuitum]OBI61034.1 pyridoxamine 5'-phosphate oxidase [Mycolicibacterium fortuitum]OBI64109.1 pyridoxamine 5'-phosphate oxidase [Mycolicibacterium fortuitum]